MAIPGVGESTLRSGPGSVLGRLSRPDRSRVIRPPRPLSDEEINALLAADVPARLATLDREGFPHVTPLWFIWDDGAFYLTSFPDRRHVRRLERDPRAGICIDVEGPERSDGERPNRQVRAVGTAELSADERGLWTRRITRKYVTGAVADERAEQRAAQPTDGDPAGAGAASGGRQRLSRRAWRRFPGGVRGRRPRAP